MELTEDNFESVLGTRSARLNDVFPKVFELLINPNLDKIVLFRYAFGIHKRLEKDAASRLGGGGKMGMDGFGLAAFKGGIVSAMMKITQDGRTDRWHGLASYYAMDALGELMRTGTPVDRRALLTQLLEHDALNVCIEKLRSHPLVIHRQVATSVLRGLCAESYLGEIISSTQTSELMVVLCHHLLAGPDLYEDQLANEDLTWQSYLCFGKTGASQEMASRYAPRYYAMSQENAAWALQGLLLRCPPANQQFCHEILTHNPDLLSLLFQCAALPRLAWYPESEVGSIICEAISMFFRVSVLRIPGIDIHLDHSSQNIADQEWNAVLESSKLLTSRPDWVRLILTTWSMMSEENLDNLYRMFKEVPERYHGAPGKTGTEIAQAIFEYRGSCRISLERLVATVLCWANQINISDADLLSLLPLAKSVSRNVKTDINRARTETEEVECVESMHELYRKPLSAALIGEDVEPPLQIAPELVLGPTVFARLLTELARRGLLDKIPTLTKLPKGVAPRTTLAKIKEIASPDAIRQFLILSRKRITARRETGHKRFKDKELDYACVAYSTAAELAAALIAFDIITKKTYSQHLGGVRRELVLCLGNAAEMALGLEYFDRALYFAAASVEAVYELPDQGDLDAVDQGIQAKNLRRVERARAGLAMLNMLE